MPLPVCILGGQRGQSKRLFNLFNQVAFARRPSHHNVSFHAKSTRRWAHVNAQSSHEGANVKNIRNIGIIAHVDAVRSLLLAPPGKSMN